MAIRLAFSRYHKSALPSIYYPQQKGTEGKRLMKPMKKSIVGGALLLSAAGIIVKVLGMLYKLPLAALLREEGMGYFNSAYTVYSFFFLLSTAGLPVAISILVSAALTHTDRGRREALRILRVTITCFALIGLTICILLVFLSEQFAAWIGNPPAAASMFVKQVVSPTEAESAAADINKDTKVTTVDLFHLKFRIMKGFWGV